MYMKLECAGLSQSTNPLTCRARVSLLTEEGITMKTAICGFLIAFVLLLFAAVMPPAIQGIVIASASAGTYEDRVPPGGFPRAGGKPWLYEDRNIRHRGGGFNQQGRQEFDNTSHSRSFVRWRRLTIVRYRDGTCSRGGVKCPCSPVSVQAKPSIKQDRNQQITVKNVGAGANVTINAAATQQVGGLGSARSTATTGDCAFAVAGTRPFDKPKPHAVRGRNPATGQCTWIY